MLGFRRLRRNTGNFLSMDAAWLAFLPLPQHPCDGAEMTPRNTTILAEPTILTCDGGENYAVVTGTAGLEDPRSPGWCGWRRRK